MQSEECPLINGSDSFSDVAQHCSDSMGYFNRCSNVSTQNSPGTSPSSTGSDNRTPNEKLPGSRSEIDMAAMYVIDGLHGWKTGGENYATSLRLKRHKKFRSSFWERLLFFCAFVHIFILTPAEDYISIHSSGRNILEALELICFLVYVRDLYYYFTLTKCCHDIHHKSWHFARVFCLVIMGSDIMYRLVVFEYVYPLSRVLRPFVIVLRVRSFRLFLSGSFKVIQKSIGIVVIIMANIVFFGYLDYVLFARWYDQTTDTNPIGDSTITPMKFRSLGECIYNMLIIHTSVSQVLVIMEYSYIHLVYSELAHVVYTFFLLITNLFLLKVIIFVAFRTFREHTKYHAEKCEKRMTAAFKSAFKLLSSPPQNNVQNHTLSRKNKHHTRQLNRVMWYSFIKTMRPCTTYAQSNLFYHAILKSSLPSQPNSSLYASILLKKRQITWKQFPDLVQLGLSGKVRTKLLKNKLRIGRNAFMVLSVSIFVSLVLAFFASICLTAFLSLSLSLSFFLTFFLFLIVSIYLAITFYVSLSFSYSRGWFSELFTQEFRIKFENVFRFKLFGITWLQGKYWDLVMVCMIGIMILHSFLLCPSAASGKWNNFIYWWLSSSILFFSFLLESCLKLWVLGWFSYLQNPFNCFDIIINIASLSLWILAIKELFSINDNSSTPTLMVYRWEFISNIRALRLLTLISFTHQYRRLSFAIRGSYQVLLRVFGFYLLTLYVYGIVSQYIYGKLMVASNPALKNTAWINLNHVLNFHSFIDSATTMFCVTFLVNWPVVMNAAVIVTSKESYFFFFGCRLLMDMVILPLIIGAMLDALDGQFESFDKIEKQRMLQYTSKGHLPNYSPAMAMVTKRNLLVRRASVSKAATIYAQMSTPKTLFRTLK